MPKWLLVGLIAVAVLWFVLTNLGSSLALSDAGARPILAFSKADTRIRVQAPAQPVAAGEARVLGGQGVMFGVRTAYRLPDGTTVTCTHRFRSLTCDGGWHAERSPGP